MQAAGSGPAFPAAFPQDMPIVRSVEDFWAWFDHTKPHFRGRLQFFEPIAERHIESLVADNVIYAEWFVPGSVMPWDEPEAIQTFSVFRDHIDRVSNGRVQIELVVCLGRDVSAERVAGHARYVTALYEAGLICGVALAGPEAGYPVKPFADTFRRLKETGMGIEIHAGEWAGPESVWDALEHGCPDRIGHGLAVFEDRRLIDKIVDDGIHLEMCPTSNLVLTKLERIEDHPVRRALALGLNFSVNTDDPGPLRCSMGSEFELLRSRLGFTDTDFAMIFENASNAAFAMVRS